MICHTTLREYVTDRQKAHRLRQHCRCCIDTRRNRMVSCYGPGHEPGGKYIRNAIASESRIKREHTAMACALMSISVALKELYEDGVIGQAVPVRVLCEAYRIMQGARS